jgi:hypothetical protein
MGPMTTIEPYDIETQEVSVMLDEDGEPTDDADDARTIETVETTYDGAEKRTYFIPDAPSS